jgi:hypothetical protein
MSQIRTSSSGGLIDRNGFSNDLISEVRAEECRCVQVDLVIEEPGKLVLESDETESNALAWEELDEQVDIASGAELSPGRRTEDCQPTDTVAAAEPGQLGLIDGDTRVVHFSSIIPAGEAGT